MFDIENYYSTVGVRSLDGLFHIVVGIGVLESEKYLKLLLVVQLFYAQHLGLDHTFHAQANDVLNYQIVRIVCNKVYTRMAFHRYEFLYVSLELKNHKKLNDILRICKFFLEYVLVNELSSLLGC